MIKLNNTIPWDVDINNPDEVKNFLISLKLYCEEIAQKAQEMQMEVRSDAPNTTMLNEGEFVRATVGGNHYIYTVKGGTVYRWQIS